MRNPKHGASAVRALAATLALLSLAGCLGGRSAKPGDSLADAELAVARAEQSRVGDYDATDLRTARENLAAARATAAASGGERSKDVLARWYASRARVDAELGLARAEATRLHAVALQLQREIDALESAAPAATPTQPSP